MMAIAVGGKVSMPLFGWGAQKRARAKKEMAIDFEVQRLAEKKAAAAAKLAEDLRNLTQLQVDHGVAGLIFGATGGERKSERR